VKHDVRRQQVGDCVRIAPLCGGTQGIGRVEAGEAAGAAGSETDIGALSGERLPDKLLEKSKSD
jgi:hypothetical protein